ncbi:hypothetical protein [Streptomyces sp. NBC_00207]|uniref:hypothetical protein n=1 Tax=unclassified Streptomyces TaxID=2593676 RepID=UPI0028880D3C|nr:hypothetical protein [Streptomyces sp. DSM 41633]
MAIFVSLGPGSPVTISYILGGHDNIIRVSYNMLYSPQELAWTNAGGTWWDSVAFFEEDDVDDDWLFNFQPRLFQPRSRVETRTFDVVPTEDWDTELGSEEIRAYVHHRRNDGVSDSIIEKSFRLDVSL